MIRSTSGTYRRAIPAQPGRIEWIEDAPAGLIRISSPEIILSTQEFENRGCNRLIDVFVAGVAALEGRVVDQRTDRPVSDAMISLLSNLACVPQGEARSDDGGAFRLPRPAAGGDLIVSAEGYATKRVGLRIGIDDQLKSTDVTVRLDPTRPLRFQIVDDSGEPVAGARLEFLDLNNGRAADARHVACVSTAQGLAVCEAFSAGQRVAAYVRHESFGNRWYIVRPEDWKTGGPVIVRLRTDVTLLGHVRTPSGAPVCGAVILIVQPVRQTGATLAERSTGTVTDASGQFKLPLPSAGPVEVHADAPGFARRRVIVPSAAIESGELDIVLTPSAILHGRVLDETGAPIARVIVNAESKLSHSDGEPLFIAQRLTDETGSFAFEGVPEGMIFKQVHVMDRRFRCESAYGVRPGDSPIEITAIAKRGAVTLCLIGQPVDELHAVLHILDRTSGRRSSRLVAIREGKASVGSLPDGELTVQIALRSHFSDRLLLHPSNDRIRRECRIVPGVRVRGRVRLDAEPSQTACLILVDRERVTPELVGSISATGDFQIESVPPGTYECHALNSGVKTRFGEITILRNRSEQQLELSR